MFDSVAFVVDRCYLLFCRIDSTMDAIQASLTGFHSSHISFNLLLSAAERTIFRDCEWLRDYSYVWRRYWAPVSPTDDSFDSQSLVFSVSTISAASHGGIHSSKWSLAFQRFVNDSIQASLTRNLDEDNIHHLCSEFKLKRHRSLSIILFGLDCFTHMSTTGLSYNPTCQSSSKWTFKTLWSIFLNPASCTQMSHNKRLRFSAE